MNFFKKIIYPVLIISLLNPSSFAFYSARKISSVNNSVEIQGRRMEFKIQDQEQKNKISDLFSTKKSSFKGHFDSLIKEWQKRRRRHQQIQKAKHFTGQASHLAAFIIALTVVGSVKHQISLARHSGKDFSWEWLQSTVQTESIHALDNGHIFAGLVGAGVVGKAVQVGSFHGRKISDKIRKHRKMIDAGKTSTSYNKIAKKQFARLISVTAMTLITFLGWEIASEFFAYSANKAQNKYVKSIERKSYIKFLMKKLDIFQTNKYSSIEKEDPFHVIIKSYLKKKYEPILKTYYGIDINYIEINKSFFERLNISLLEELVRLYYSSLGFEFDDDEALKIIKEFYEIDKKPYINFLMKNLDTLQTNQYSYNEKKDPFHVIIRSYLKGKYEDFLKTDYEIDINLVEINESFFEKLDFYLLEQLVQIYKESAGLKFDAIAFYPDELQEYVKMVQDPHLYEKIISNTKTTGRNAKVLLEMLEVAFDDDSNVLYNAFRKRIFTGEFVTFSLGLSVGAFVSSFIPGVGFGSGIGRFVATISFVSLFVFGVPQKYQDSITRWIQNKRIHLFMSKIAVEQKKILQDYKNWIVKSRNLDSVKSGIKRRFKKLSQLREKAVHVASEIIPAFLITLRQKYSSIALINQTLDETYVPQINAFSIYYHAHDSYMNVAKIALKKRREFSCGESDKIRNYKDCYLDKQKESNNDIEAEERENIKFHFSNLSKKGQQKLREERAQIVQDIKILEKNFFPIQYEILRIYADQWRFFNYIIRQIKYFDTISYKDQKRMNERKDELAKLFEEEEKSLLDLYKTHSFHANSLIQTDPRSCIYKLISNDQNIHRLYQDKDSNKVAINKNTQTVENYLDYMNKIYENTGKSQAHEKLYNDIKDRLHQTESAFHSYVTGKYGDIVSLLEYIFYIYSDRWGGSSTNPDPYSELEELKFNSINNESLAVSQVLVNENSFKESVRKELAKNKNDGLKNKSCLLSVRSVPLTMQNLNQKQSSSNCKKIQNDYEEYLFECMNY